MAVTLDWVIVWSYANTNWLQRLLAQLAINPNDQQGYTLSNGVIRFQGRLVVGNDEQWKNNIMQVLHGSPLRGHSGVRATYYRVRQLFYWLGQKTEVVKCVLACEVCQRCKHEQVALPGLLQPLSIPDQAREGISMDFIEGLPKSEAKDVILVVADRLTKFAHFLSLTHPFSAQEVARLFLDLVGKIHGIPKTIVSDRDKIFTSSFWQELFRSLGVGLRMSTTYHCETDGQTERVNQCLEAYLRCMCFTWPRSWNKWLFLAQWWYNLSYHSAIKRTPFEALFGYNLPLLGYP